MISPILCECAHVFNLLWQLFGYNKIYTNSGL